MKGADEGNTIVLVVRAAGQVGLEDRNELRGIGQITRSHVEGEEDFEIEGFGVLEEVGHGVVHPPCREGHREVEGKGIDS